MLRAMSEPPGVLVIAERTQCSAHAPLCRAYAQQGDSRASCRFGSRCRYRHEPVCAWALPAAAPTISPPPSPAAAAAPVFAATPLLSLDWPLRAGPPLVAEVALRRVLLLSETESGRGRDLPPARLASISAAAAPAGLTLPAALSLRRLFIRQVSGNAAFFADRDMGEESGAKSHADRFEALLAAHMAAAGAAVTSEAALAAAGAGDTPDLLLRPPVLVNGRPVSWMDAKTFYGAACLAVSAATPAMPPAKLAAQAARYCRVYGPGAFVFLNGFSRDLALAAGLGDGVTLLDATPIAGVEALFDAA